ncbi:hypothetical protein HDE79_003187 [Rhodanobacter sp. MP1X3]|nr:hypothetical protein [Rhodanobacter sp. MP1X3]
MDDGLRPPYGRLWDSPRAALSAARRLPLTRPHFAQRPAVERLWRRVGEITTASDRDRRKQKLKAGLQGDGGSSAKCALAHGCTIGLVLPRVARSKIIVGSWGGRMRHWIIAVGVAIIAGQVMGRPSDRETVGGNRVAKYGAPECKAPVLSGVGIPTRSARPAKLGRWIWTCRITWWASTKSSRRDTFV